MVDRLRRYASPEAGSGIALRSADGELRDGGKCCRDLTRLLPATICTCDHEERVTLYNRAVDLRGREPEKGRTRRCGPWRLHRPDLGRSPKAEFDDHLAKPADHRELLALIEKAGRKAEMPGSCTYGVG